MATFLSRPATAPAASYEITDSGNSNMKVVVRIRPENELEIRSNCQAVTKVLDEHVLVFDPSPDNAPTFQDRGPSGHKRRFNLGKKHKDLRFAFDRVFDETSSQVDVFEHTTRHIIDGVLDGINCSVFAYGATGAGKTYTMLGNLENPGVMFLTMMELYRRINQLRDEKIFEVAVSYCEVYNETLRDLLVPSSGTLHLRDDGQNGLVVSGLTKHQPQTANDILSLLEIGNGNRTQHPTDANATSSRSHAVFQVFIHQKARTAGLSTQVTCAKMSLIDLAGSERATVSTNRGSRLREGANINKSLLALGNCINALADNKGKTGHVPYRNSKLTRLLKDSLGGNCRTVMIANVSPSALSYEDSYNTLKYADRAKQIKTKCVRNVLNVDFHVVKYKKIVQELQKEISELKAKLAKKTPKKQAVSTTEAERLQDLVQGVYGERARLRKHMADLDASEREALLKVCRKERDFQRIDTLTGNEAKKAKVSARVEMLRQRILEVQRKKQSVHECLFSNNESTGKVQAEINASCSASSAMPALQQLMETCVAAKKLESENAYQWKQTKHLLKYIKSQEKEISRTERMLVLSLELVRRQQTVLRASHTVTSSIQEMYDGLVRMAEGGKGVAWADLSSDSLHDVSVSSLSQSQQALFDSFLVHSSPAHRGAAGSQRNSPSIASSLGILSSITETEVSANSGGTNFPAPRNSKCAIAHPLFEAKSKPDITVPSPQPDIVQSSRLMRTVSPVQLRKSGTSVPQKLVPRGDGSSVVTYNTRLNTVLNSSSTVKSSLIASTGNRNFVSSTCTSSSSQKSDLQSYTLPRPSPKTSPKARDGFHSDDKLVTSTSATLPHPVDTHDGPHFTPLRPPSYIPPPEFSRTAFNVFDDNFVSPARPHFSKQGLPKTPVSVLQQPFVKQSPSLQNLHPNPNNFVPALHQVSPAVLCRPITSPLPSYGGHSTALGLPTPSSFRVSQLASSSHAAETFRAERSPFDVSRQRPTYQELIMQSRQSRGNLAAPFSAVQHSQPSLSGPNPALPMAIVTPSPLRPSQSHRHLPPPRARIAVSTSTSHQPSHQPDFHRRDNRELSDEPDLNSTYTISDESDKSAPFQSSHARPVSAFSTASFNPLVVLHANSPKAISARHRAVGGTSTGVKRNPSYLQMTKAAASKRVMRAHNKENQPSSNGKPVIKPKRLHAIQPRLPPAPQPVW